MLARVVTPMDHDKLNGLFWSESGHYIDALFNMNGESIFNCGDLSIDSMTPSGVGPILLAGDWRLQSNWVFQFGAAGNFITEDGSNNLTIEAAGILALNPASSIVIGDGAAGVDYSITFDGETNDGIIKWLEDEDVFSFDKGITIGVGAAGVDYSLTFDGETNDGVLSFMEDENLFRFDKGVIIGAGAAGVDYSLLFDGETNDGVITWMEDEDYFNFADKIRVLDIETLSSSGIKIPNASGYAFSIITANTTGLYFNYINSEYEFHNTGSARGGISASTGYSFHAYNNIALTIQDNSYAFVLHSLQSSGMYFNNSTGNIELRYLATPYHYFNITTGVYKLTSYIEMQEETAPAAPGVNLGRIFMRDTGGLTELCVIFNTGAIQVIAAQP